MSNTSQQEELVKFDALAQRWWDPDGDMRPLHDINPARTSWIDRRVGLAGKRVLDVGCGAGLLSEAMTRAGAHVIGIDLAPGLIEAATAHAADSGLDVVYQCRSTRDLAAEAAGRFDLVTCLEMLEHVDDPGVIVDDCARLVKPGGAVVFSTINRSPAAWLLAIAGAEYVLGLLPRGTHEYAKFIRPSELSGWARHSGLATREIAGMHYNPFLRTTRFGTRPDVNYFLHAVRPTGDGA
ncbi:bifunctional 2-polyprenyl-6-hydroxyphenol methylase/3-demethylubiquinol 3-O-methyltransferase UbiG [Spectribacter hydrogenoxidans]|uniref:Ubiquinone biosynthesis O-methyltransferase n=1 Tax=Spectribacter hydrogenoxidans TaxID=3075608 RepID=A0ABU3C1L3_9GAMM|nr:bifunctional 2-polyprenyl-6-hydroxyphenol methylase/3-demethylubiquinol 3-O-methyltransferase UbiG [Salinisphaera sp. W335]MDT0635448.1 bifunctional 2-polyprenyl-6-hydroxyphenol methylase/3-demethylubiquinol 3-O-methyltransferase UbiG [Salinisphaera sp. W335]